MKRTEQEIRDSIIEMERMALSAKNALNTPTVKESPFLTRKFELWEHRCQARVNILKWVLDEPYLTDEQIEVNL